MNCKDEDRKDAKVSTETPKRKLHRISDVYNASHLVSDRCAHPVPPSPIISLPSVSSLCPHRVLCTQRHSVSLCNVKMFSLCSSVFVILMCFNIFSTKVSFTRGSNCRGHCRGTSTRRTRLSSVVLLILNYHLPLVLFSRSKCPAVSYQSSL